MQIGEDEEGYRLEEEIRREEEIEDEEDEGMKIEEEQRKQRKKQRRERSKKRREERRMEEEESGEQTAMDVAMDVDTESPERITLDVGGRHFATTRSTLKKMPNSLFDQILRDGKQNYFIDRDGGHFRYTLNYLRADGNMDIATLPRENRYLLELRNESIFYNLLGLRDLITSRLEMYSTMGIAF